MWRLAGVYDALYMSEGKRASDVLEVIDRGVAFMIEHPKECREHDASNGWGTYKDALPWLQRLRDAFRDNPDAIIGVSK